jgi:hypothetical protein
MQPLVRKNVTAEEIIVRFCGRQTDVYSHKMFLTEMKLLFTLNNSKEHMNTVLQAGRIL